jgi:hypothetical protein
MQEAARAATLAKFLHLNQLLRNLRHSHNAENHSPENAF